MENEITVSVFFGFISSVLLAVVAYFIRQLHTDFKSMERDMTEVKTMALIIKTEFKNLRIFSIRRLNIWNKESIKSS